MNTKVEQILELAVKNKASDIHLSEIHRPKLRVYGKLLEVTQMEMGAGVGREMIMSLVPEAKKAEMKKKKEVDFSVTMGSFRFRANLFWVLGKLTLALRLIPPEVPGFAELNLPEVLKTWLTYAQGFVLVTGPTGQGKSTTVAAMLSEINKSRNCHIVTIEDPIEYLIKPNKAMISQRELGRDTDSFSKALRSCFRQDPDVVFVGEMRDLQTISTALTVAETGHLVFSTLHTNSASQTIDRIVDVFDDASKGQIRLQLAAVLTAVVSQRLIPSVDGKRVPAFEVLVANSAVRNTIREGKTHMIDNIIQTSSDVGMFTLEHSLASLVKAGLVEERVAMSYALRPDELQSRLRKGKL